MTMHAVTRANDTIDFTPVGSLWESPKLFQRYWFPGLLRNWTVRFSTGPWYDIDPSCLATNKESGYLEQPGLGQRQGIPLPSTTAYWNFK